MIPRHVAPTPDPVFDATLARDVALLHDLVSKAPALLVQKQNLTVLARRTGHRLGVRPWILWLTNVVKDAKPPVSVSEHAVTRLAAQYHHESISGR